MREPGLASVRFQRPEPYWESCLRFGTAMFTLSGGRRSPWPGRPRWTQLWLQHMSCVVTVIYVTERWRPGPLVTDFALRSVVAVANVSALIDYC